MSDTLQVFQAVVVHRPADDKPKLIEPEPVLLLAKDAQQAERQIVRQVNSSIPTDELEVIVRPFCD